MEKTYIDLWLEKSAKVVYYMPELLTIQAKLKVPKDKRNDFGKYYYRSASDILEQVKPILEEVKCVLITPSTKLFSTDGKNVRVYAILTNSKGETMFATHDAGLEDSKKGMDLAQVSGAAESYAKKYALGNLFAIDDTKDADATNTNGKEVAPVAPAVDEEIEIAIHQCATREELTKLMNSQKGWLENPAIRAMANEYYKELK